MVLSYAVSTGVSTAAAATPAGPTGNLLVLLDRHRAIAAATGAVHAVLARLGGRPAGRSVPEIGLITVRPAPGQSLSALARTMKRVSGVSAVQVEHRYVPRLVPNDPTLNTPNQYSGVVQWTLAREGFYNAWNITRGDGALVGVIDTGIGGSHPDV